jgi:hypothetical protein
MSVTVLGQPMIIVNSPKVTVDLLEKRSIIYSDRPVLMMGSEIVGWKNTLALTPYGPRFRAFRKLIFRTIGTHGNMERYYPLEELETKKFLARVLARPNRLSSEIRRYRIIIFVPQHSHIYGCFFCSCRTAGSIILMISHGYRVNENDDPIVNIVDKATEQFSLCTEPGAFLVDVFPVCT